jgi:phage terminase small subunit
MADLTAKQASFIAGIISGSTQSDAYRDAYDAENMTDKQIWEEACKLAATPKVSQRLFEYQKELRERLLVSVESITSELNNARDLAEEEKQPSAMTGAIMGKAKLHGLLIERQEVKNFTVTITGEDADL